MKAIEVEQLKARLSEYVRLVKAGETVLVTEHDEAVAELRPARRQIPVADRLEELLDALAASGEITRAAQPNSDWTWRSRGQWRPRPRSTDLRLEVRRTGFFGGSMKRQEGAYPGRPRVDMSAGSGATPLPLNLRITSRKSWPQRSRLA